MGYGRFDISTQLDEIRKTFSEAVSDKEIAEKELDERNPARSLRADKVVRSQCGLRSINLKRAAQPHVSF